ncbi:MAG: hypothetical protein NTZ05_13965, partial [Chloroflexi bacterium]|nr:hypothetical protein [Chloroflexota bacterium]
LGRSIDVIFEATGNSAVAMDALGILGVNGIMCLTSITGGDAKRELPADAINQRMVLGNRVVFGSVTSNRSHYEMAIRDLAAFQTTWPGVIERVITHRFPLADYAAALDAVAGRGGIKVTLDITEG